MSALAATIDFEDLPAGTVVRNDYVARFGVRFEAARIVESPAGGKALEGWFDGQLREFHGHPITIHFDQLQASVSVKTGLGRNVPTVPVTLRAFDDSDQVVDSSRSSPIGPGPTSIDTRLSVSTATPRIRRVEVWIENNIYREVIDDLEFDRATSLPSDSVTPIVRIDDPPEATVVNQALFNLEGAIFEHSGLVDLRLTIESPGQPTLQTGPIPLRWEGSAPDFTFGPIQTGPLYEGTNTITVTATDLFHQVGRASRTVTYQPPAATPTADVYCTGIEVTQVVNTPRIYDPHGTGPVTHYVGVPLVAGKRTVVRVYGAVKGSSSPVQNVFCDLYGLRDGKYLSQQPIRANGGTNGITIDPSLPINEVRRSLNRTWNFVLPREWIREGSIDLVARVRYQDECSGCDNLFNQMTLRRLHFHTTAEMYVYPIRACIRRDPDVDRTVCDWVDEVASTDVLVDANSIFPVVYPVADGDLNIRFLSNPVEYHNGDFGNDCGASDDQPCNGTMSEDRFSSLLSRVTSRVNQDLLIGLLHGIPIAPPNHVYAAMIPGPTDNGLLGLAKTGLNSSVNLVRPTNLTTDSVTVAHEIGHNFGRRHVAGCANPARTDDDYPWYSPPGLFDPGQANTGPLANIGEWGLDTRRVISSPLFARYDPAITRDYMSYCGSNPLWVSPYTYRASFNVLRYALTFPGASTKSPKRLEQIVQKGVDRTVTYVLVQGAIDDDGQARFEPFYTYTRSALDLPPDGGGTYTLTLEDAAGRTLASRSFDLEATADHTPGHGEHIFAQILPYPAGVARIALSQRGNVLLSRTVSTSAPTVTIISPDGGEDWTANSAQTVRWSGQDPDGDSLSYTVQYSIDGGESWQTIAANVEGSELPIDTAQLAGSDAALVLVRATDGVHTATDTSSATFRVADKTPLLRLLEPAEGARFRRGEPVPLLALATDREDGPLNTERVRWESSRDGLLGVGRRLDADGLSVGEHDLTVAAEDSGGNFAAQTVTVEVFEDPLRLELFDVRVVPSCERSVSHVLELSWLGTRTNPFDPGPLEARRFTLSSATSVVEVFEGPFAPSGSLAVPLSQPHGGTFLATLEATDAAGERTSASVEVTLPPCETAAATGSVDLGDPDLESGVARSAGAPPTDGDSEPVACGPEGQEREARRNWLTDPADGVADPYFYFEVTDELLKNARALRIEAVVHDDPHAAGTDVELEYTNAAATGPEDVANVFASHSTTHTLGGTGRWRTLRWEIEDAGFRSLMPGSADFRLATTASVCLDEVRVSEYRLDVSFSTERLDTASLAPATVVDDLAVAGPAGTRGQAEVFVNIHSLLAREGVRGWSLGLVVEGSASILDAEIEGTAADAAPAGYRQDGFATRTVLSGNKNVITAVVLGTRDLASLPLAGTRSVLKIVLQSDRPLGDETQQARLFLVDGLRDGGRPLENVITVGHRSHVPAGLQATELRLSFSAEPQPERGSVSAGFSAERVSSAIPFDGLVGAGIPDSGRPTELVVEVPRGTRSPVDVHVNLVSELEDEGVSGWSLAVVADGEGEIDDASTDGTTAAAPPDGIRQGFDSTIVIDPSRNGGRQGVISAVVLFTGQEVTLPRVGTESVLKLSLRPAAPQGEDEQVVRLAFENGLVGDGAPTNNVISVGRTSRTLANQDEAFLTVRFRSTSEPIFTRGDVNTDGTMDITDAIVSLAFQFLGLEGGLDCHKSADVNDDSVIDITDPVYALSYQFLGSAPPVAPFGSCGPDPTRDALPCERFAPCQR